MIFVSVRYISIVSTLSILQVHFIWECKFKLQLKQNPGQAETIKQMIVPEPMNPREAFYGGRTNCRQMHYKCGPEEQIKYIDICRYDNVYLISYVFVALVELICIQSILFSVCTRTSASMAHSPLDTLRSSLRTLSQ
jgi:hypothetical protein